MSIRSLLLALGLAHFTVAGAFAQSSATWTVTGSWGAAGYARAGDYNGDGKTDIASPYGAVVHMKLSTGSGFTSTTWTVDNGSTQWASSGYVVGGDFNCDGLADFGITDKIKSNGQFSAKINNGNGTFSTYSWAVQDPVGYSWGDGTAKAFDYDGDGCKDDLMSIRTRGPLWNDDYVWVLTGAPTGFSVSFSTVPSMSYDENVNGWWFYDDFNCDGRDDAAIAYGTSVRMRFSPFSFANSTIWSSVGAWGANGFARSGKVNTTPCDPSNPNRRAADILSPTGTTMYLKTNTNPNFTNSSWTTNGTWGNDIWTFVGDFTGDGRSELASANGNNVYMKFP